MNMSHLSYSEKLVEAKGSRTVNFMIDIRKEFDVVDKWALHNEENEWPIMLKQIEGV